MAVVSFDVDQGALADAAAGGGGGVVPEGAYVLRVKSTSWDPPKQQGAFPRFVLKCEILWSFNGGNIGKTVTRRLSMSPKAIPYFTIPFMQAAGVPVQQTQNGGIAFDDQQVLGVSTRVQCSHSKGEQRTFEDWTADEPVAGGQPGVPAPAPQGPPQGAPWQQPQPQGPPQGVPVGPPQGGAPPWQQPQQPAPQQSPAPWQPQAQQQQPAPAPQQPQPAASPWAPQLPPRGQG